MIKLIERRDKGSLKIEVINGFVDQTIRSEANFEVTHNVGVPPISVIRRSSGKLLDYTITPEEGELKCYQYAKKYAETRSRHFGFDKIDDQTSFARVRESKLVIGRDVPYPL